MNVVTRTKPFSWSYSKLKNFETCPLRYKEVDLAKPDPDRAQDRSPELERGDEMHEAMRNRVGGSTPLPPHFIYMERWAEKLSRVLHPTSIIQCELKLATTKDGKPSGYGDRNTWLRGRIDYLNTIPEWRQGLVVDYKTGKMPKVWDGTQLTINAYLIFQHYHYVNKVRVDYLWTEYNDTTHEKYTRDQMPELMAAITPRVAKLEEAHNTGVYEPKPCGLCRDYCPVSSCEYWGKGASRK